MNLIIKCSQCHKQLNIRDGVINSLGEIAVVVDPCTNMDCYDCSKCELEKENKSLKAIIKEISQTIKKLVTKQKEKDEVYKIWKGNSTQDLNKINN